MKLAAKCLVLFLWLGTILADAQIPYPNPLKHIVVIVQENRTPDNLFGAFLNWPGINPMNYDIATSGLAQGYGTVQLTPVALANDYDPIHNHSAFELMYDGGKMDGANLIPITCNQGATDCTNGGKGEFLPYKYVDNSTGLLDPYFSIAAQYGWSNFMFQTNQGPSFAAHQFIFSGTSAQSASDDAGAIFVAENPSAPRNSGYTPGRDTGCLAPIGEWNWLISPSTAPAEQQLVNTGGTLCFTHDTMATWLDDAGLNWKYYGVAGGYIWEAPDAIYAICQPNSSYTECMGPEWTANVVSNQKIFADTAHCNLPSVSWVIPDGKNSDHAGSNEGGGPSWVASIVNAIGNATRCDNEVGYWNDTAIVITWDDWGGWYDHEPPTILAGPQGDYQYGFRVPMLVVSAFTPQAYVSNIQYDFGSILRFIEGTFGIQEGALGFADSRTRGDLNDFFNFEQTPRPFQSIQAPLDANFFLHDSRPAVPPDDD